MCQRRQQHWDRGIENRLSKNKVSGLRTTPFCPCRSRFASYAEKIGKLYHSRVLPGVSQGQADSERNTHTHTLSLSDIYIYMHMYIYIYLYTYRDIQGVRSSPSPSQLSTSFFASSPGLALPELRTKDLETHPPVSGCLRVTLPDPTLPSSSAGPWDQVLQEQAQQNPQRHTGA